MTSGKIAKLLQGLEWGRYDIYEEAHGQYVLRVNDAVFDAILDGLRALLLGQGWASLDDGAPTDIPCAPETVVLLGEICDEVAYCLADYIDGKWSHDFGRHSTTEEMKQEGWTHWIQLPRPPLEETTHVDS